MGRKFGHRKDVRSVLATLLSLAMMAGCKRKTQEEASIATDPVPPPAQVQEERDFAMWKFNLAYPDGRLFTCAYVLNARASDFIATSGENNLATFRRNSREIVVATSRPVDSLVVAEMLEDLQSDMAREGQTLEGTDQPSGSRLGAATELYVKAIQEVDKAGLSRRPNIQGQPYEGRQGRGHQTDPQGAPRAVRALREVPRLRRGRQSLRGQALQVERAGLARDL